MIKLKRFEVRDIVGGFSTHRADTYQEAIDILSNLEEPNLYEIYDNEENKVVF